MSIIRRRLLMQQKKSIAQEVIEFVDAEVKRVCIENWSSDGKTLSISDARNIKTLGGKFKDNTIIQYFNELADFTSVTTLYTDEFYGCTKLEEIDLSNIINIQQRVFFNSGLSIDVSTPNLKRISAGAFNGTKIKKIKNLGSVTSIPDLSGSSGGVFQNCKSLISVVLPDTLKIIGWNAFYECTSLESVALPLSLTSINTMAFRGCSVLSNMPLPQSLLSIQNGAFYQTSLTGDIDLPNLNTLAGGAFNGTKISSINNLGNIKSIATPSNGTGGVFQNCTELKKVVLPASLQSIGNVAFSGCTQLSKIIVNATVPPSLAKDAFNKISAELLIYVPDESVEAYKTATGWINYANRIKPISEYIEP